MTILIIEDSDDDAELLQIGLHRIRFVGHVQVVSRAEQAILYLQGRAPYENRRQFPLPNLIFLDLGLPGMSGSDFLKWLRTQPELNIPLVAVLTGSPYSADLDEAYRLGARRFFLKPIGQHQLEQLIGLVPTVGDQAPGISAVAAAGNDLACEPHLSASCFS